MPAAASRSAEPNDTMKRVTAIALAWTAFALLSSTHFFLASESGSALGDLASHIFLFYGMWALLTPLVLWQARDIALQGSPGWIRAGLLAPIVVLVHGVLYLAALRMTGVEPTLALSAAALTRYTRRHGGGDLATYAIIVALWLLIDARRRAREREQAALLLETRLARADLELLRWQLQPHFLFNTLNTLSTLVLQERTGAADRAIGLIASWLRAALNQRADTSVTLREELANVQRYVAIEALRFGDGLRLETVVDVEALDVGIPPLLVQPLVENAIHHGASDGALRGPITVSGRIADGRLLLAVQDSGPARAPSGTAPTDGFGLRYVRSRLVHAYGDDARLALERTGTQTVARLDLPLAMAT